MEFITHSVFFNYHFKKLFLSSFLFDCSLQPRAPSVSGSPVPGVHPSCISLWSCDRIQTNTFLGCISVSVLSFSVSCFFRRVAVQVLVSSLGQTQSRLRPMPRSRCVAAYCHSVTDGHFLCFQFSATSSSAGDIWPSDACISMSQIPEGELPGEGYMFSLIIGIIRLLSKGWITSHFHHLWAGFLFLFPWQKLTYRN